MRFDALLYYVLNQKDEAEVHPTQTKETPLVNSPLETPASSVMALDEPETSETEIVDLAQKAETVVEWFESREEKGKTSGLDGEMSADEPVLPATVENQDLDGGLSDDSHQEEINSFKATRAPEAASTKQDEPMPSITLKEEKPVLKSSGVWNKEVTIPKKPMGLYSEKLTFGPMEKPAHKKKEGNKVTGGDSWDSSTKRIVALGYFGKSFSNKSSDYQGRSDATQKELQPFRVMMEDLDKMVSDVFEEEEDKNIRMSQVITNIKKRQK